MVRHRSTGVSLGEVELALASGASKAHQKCLELIHDLEGFDNWTSLESFMRHYDPDDTETGRHLQGRSAKLFFLYRGPSKPSCRYRFANVS